jgi:hypothetical protein
MKKLYCDRCKKEVDKLYIIKIPDPDKPINFGSYSTKDVEVCSACNTFIENAVREYSISMIKVKFAFYETLFSISKGI